VAWVAVVLARVALSLRSLALAAVVVLALSPAALLGPSFQMSFAAAIALVSLFEGPWTARLRRRGEGLSGLTAIAHHGLMVAVSSLIDGLATAPFVAYHFHAMSVVGVLANLLAVPLTALWIMPAGVLALAVMGRFWTPWAGASRRSCGGRKPSPPGRARKSRLGRWAAMA
ncbi:MAG: ComEC/Rec2 family competence protein, partial [Pseudomonadota bacterium]|nr:ComEC/Rec2 family competence protein [Pseudomonadota bacterium]